MEKIFALLFVLLLVPQASFAKLCHSPSTPYRVGEMDEDFVTEASGIAVSTKFEDRLYHINDSGDGPFFYVTKTDGTQTRKVRITNFRPYDVEDLAYGKCLGGKQCLVIGDIGDNAEWRRSIKLVFVEEVSFRSSVTPLKKITAIYPDRAHNAEGMAFHPNGDLYILTKEMKNDVPQIAMLFKLSKKQIEEGGEQELQKVQDFDLPSILGEFSKWGQIVTGFDISKDGKKLLILTYEAVVEVMMDLNVEARPVSGWVRDENYVVITANDLPQQEAISYFGDFGFIYNTENHGSAPLMQVRCQ